MRSFSILNLPGFMVLSLLGSQIHCVWSKIIGVCNDKKRYLIKTENFSQRWLEKGTLKITYNELDGNTSIIPFRDQLLYLLFAKRGRLTFTGLAGCPISLLADTVLRGCTPRWRGVILIRTRKASADSSWRTFWFVCPRRTSCGSSFYMNWWYMNW